MAKDVGNTVESAAKDVGKVIEDNTPDSVKNAAKVVADEASKAADTVVKAVSSGDVDKLLEDGLNKAIKTGEDVGKFLADP